MDHHPPQRGGHAHVFLVGEVRAIEIPAVEQAPSALDGGDVGAGAGVGGEGAERGDGAGSGHAGEELGEEREGRGGGGGGEEFGARLDGGVRPFRPLREVADGVGVEDADGGGEGAARGGGFHRV